MKLCIFSHQAPDSKWSEYTINCSEQALPIMNEIIAKTSLIRLSDLQMIEKIITKALTP